MADTGWKFPGTTSGIRDSGGTESWANPGNIAADDGSVASVTHSGFASSLGLSGTNFDFSVIPSGSTIDGIEAQVGDYREALTSALWAETGLALADQSDGTEDKFSELAAITGSNQTDQMGGASDLWSETIARSDVQDIDWGFWVRTQDFDNGSTVHIDFMQMKIYYTEGGSFPYHALLPRKRSMNALMTL